jgi:hypothetical protein
MRHPKVFISYSWENEAHKNWVRRLAVELQDNGTEVVLDQWDSYPGMDIPTYMEKSVRESDFVLLICTPPFARKANSGTGGVGYEKIVVTGEIFVGSNSAGKFIPIVRSGAPEEALPSYLKSKLYLDFRDEGQFRESLEALLRHLHGSPRFVRPPIGNKPDLAPAAAKEEEEEEEEEEEGGSLAVYCVRCGRKAGGYSSCLSGSSHEYASFSGAVYCSRCGRVPGEYTSCLSGRSHNYRSLLYSVYCTFCGRKPGSYTSCLSGSDHQYSSFTGPVYCSHCGKAPGEYTSCLAGGKHRYTAF